MITSRSLVYLVYAALIVIVYLGDRILNHGSRKVRVWGYVLSLVGDFAILGYGLYLYFAKGLDQAGFVLGGVLFGIAILCLLGRYWQNKERDKREKQDEKTMI
jgi:hypothetical protein